MIRIKIKVKSEDLYKIVWRKDGDNGKPHYYKDGSPEYSYKLRDLKVTFGSPTPDVWDSFVNKLNTLRAAIFKFPNGVQYKVIKRVYKNV